MKFQGLLTERMKRIAFALMVLPFLFLVACEATPPPVKPTVQNKDNTPLRPRTKKLPKSGLKPLAQLKPSVATHRRMPFEGKVFSLSARSAPLQDVVMGLAKEAELNLVIAKDVNPMEPVSVEINNLGLRKALDIIFAAYDYYYVIDGNTLWVKSVETRFFRLEVPPYLTTGTSSGAGQGASGISGGFTVSTQVEDDKLDIWKQIEEALKPSKGSSSQGEILSEKGSARVDRISSTIIVTDRPEILDKVALFLKRMEDAARRQVVIDSRIFEVRLNKDHEYGIDWSGFAKQINSDFNIAGQMNNATTGQNTLLTFATANYGTVMINMLQTQGDVNVLSSPRIHVMNNQSAVLNIGTQLPYILWNRECDANGLNCQWVPSVEKEQTGVSLGVTPTISEDGIVTLHIVPVINTFVGWETAQLPGVDAPTYRVPIIDSRGVDSVVQAPDGTTVVIGGLIQTTQTENRQGVPFLMDVPILGFAFSNQQVQNRKSELVISLTPNIIIYQ